MAGQIKVTDIYNKLVDGKIIVTNIKKHYINGVLYAETYLNDKNMIHRDENSYGGDGPAEIRYADDGKLVKYEAWYRDGSLHRDDGLATITRLTSNDNSITELMWYINGKLDREGNLPTTAHYNNKTDKAILLIWNKGGIKDRNPYNGPAEIHYDENGDVDNSLYFVNGTMYENVRLAKLNYMFRTLGDDDLDKCIEFAESLKK